jgi:hypothetical protein
MPPTTAGFFMPPAPSAQALAVAPAAPYPALAVAAPAPALAGVFINQHVPVVLSLNPSNYSTWRTLFELTFSKYGIMDHILGAPRPHDAQWVQDDAFICSWLYNRVSAEILGLVHQRAPTAANVWRAIATLFLDNAETQAVFVGTDFRSLMQGDMTILRYFARLKEYADQLADLGYPVDDKAQVMNMFRGLNPRFFYAIPILTMQLPFPSFLRCRAFLILEESRLNMVAAPPSDTALHDLVPALPHHLPATSPSTPHRPCSTSSRLPSSSSSSSRTSPLPTRLGTRRRSSRRSTT